MTEIKEESVGTGMEIAVIGMAGRFPGAENIDEFWNNLKQGVESISFFSHQEINESGITPGLLENPCYVKVKGALENIEDFDAAFFEYTAREAEIMDPQLRILHESCWQALENAAYDPLAYKGLIGFYAGAGNNHSWLAHFLSRMIESRMGANELFEIGSLNSSSSFCTRISYKLNLKGPSIFVQTACSTSLVAIHLACQGLLAGECDMALAGGVSVSIPKKSGHLYQEGMVLSLRGHVRTFDAHADGTVFGNGVGIVLLKPLENAIADGDTIHAVVKGSAINNDGYQKVGFTAPGTKGQAAVIRAALRAAEVKPESISYIETHGTGTTLGDPIEIEALTRAFKTNKTGFCKIGSVKSNIGHLDAAAGAAGFIKTVLALKYRMIPPSLNFESPNPEIDFENSPFRVNTTLTEWKKDKYPLRAGVSSFGLGGSNAHVVLEESPVIGHSSLVIGERNEREYQLILLSARTESALDKMTENLKEYLKNNLANPGNPANAGLNLVNTAYTLQVGRKAFPYRRMLVCSTNDAAETIEDLDSGAVETRFAKKEKNTVIFMFSGQGSQYVNMGLDLYKSEPQFRSQVDYCFNQLEKITGKNMKTVLYPGEKDIEEAEKKIHQILYTSPIKFIFEYALAEMLIKWGVQPAAMIGHSFGEYVAACLSGVFSLEDGLFLAALRGELIDRLPEGAMSGVPLSEKQLKPLLTDELSIAAINGESLCVVSGTIKAVNSIEKKLNEKGHDCLRFQVPKAGHSRMMEPILEEFREKVNRVSFKAPQIPYISGLTGEWITAWDAVDPGYWTRHMRETIRFADGLATLFKEPNPIFLQVSPGRGLTLFVEQHPHKTPAVPALNLVRHRKREVSDVYYTLNQIGQLWLQGVTINWKAFYAGEKRYRIPLPTYPFEGQNFRVEVNFFQVEKENLQRQPLSNRENVHDRPGSPGPMEMGGKGRPLHKRAKRPKLKILYNPPSNNTEQALVDMWEKFFGMNPIGIDDDFFDLGGDSLKASILISKIHKEFNVKVPLPAFFEGPTIRCLALFTAGNTGENTYFSIESVEEKEYYQLSSAQKRLYFFRQMDHRGLGYNIPSIAILEGNLDKTKLENTFRRLIKRHESFRTSFEMIEDEPVQKIHEDFDFEIEYFDSKITKVEVKVKVEEGKQTTGKNLKNLPYEPSDPESQELRAKSYINDFIRPFDLSQAPLLRVGLIKEKEEKHILMVDMHHIIADGTSFGLLIRDSMSLFEGEELPELRIQYKDFSKWQNNEKLNESIKQQKEYWLKEFNVEIPILNLPTDYPRPAIHSFEGSTIDFEIGTKETIALLQLAKKEETTLYIVLLATFNVLLARLSNQEDIIIGTPVAGRRNADLGQIIGMFVNTLTMRNFPESGKKFNDFLGEVRESTLNAFENQEYPFEELVQRLPIKRDMSRNPLFDVMFVLQNIDFPEIKTPGLKITSYEYKRRISKFDLTLWIVEVENFLVFTFEYRTKLFREETIEMFICYFKVIISSILNDPYKNISEIEIITKEEKSQILFGFNNTKADNPEDKLIHELFEEQVEKTPDSIAVVYLEESVRKELTHAHLQVTYRELNEKSNQLAHLLRGKGVRSDITVGILVERSMEMVVGIFAILKAGGVYSPIDPEYPKERSKYILKDIGTKLLLSKKAIGKRFECLCELMDLEDMDLYTGNKSNLEKINRYVDLGYVLYTSGSTGKPKGVMVEHRSIVNILFALSKEYPFSKRDTYLLKTSYVFDVSVSEIFGWFLGGGRLAIHGRDVEKDPEMIVDAIERYYITHINFVPSMFNAFLETLNNQTISKLFTLKYVFLAGEALLPQLVKKFRNIAPSVVLENIYGPTEATIYASKYSLQDWKVTNKIPIGKPMHNVEIYILNKWSKLRPIGIPGELCISGLGVAKGYLNHPELTAEKFEEVVIGHSSPIIISSKRTLKTNDNSEKSFSNHRLYRTGDRARWLSDGNIEFLGRMDDQVKVRGNRIELGEIENQLLNHDQIKEVVVTAKEDDSGNKFLCAYIVSDKLLTVTYLRSYLSRNLPDYMLPSYFIPMEKIPLTPSGKVDRQRLPEPGTREMSSGMVYIGPRNIIEKKLVEIWQKVLGRHTVSINDNFFEIGGDSIKTIQIVSRMRKTGYKLKMRDIFRNPRISELATLVKKVERIADQSVITGTVPLTPIQVWFFENILTDRHHFNQAVMLVLEEDFGKEAVKAVFTKIQEHHDALRMIYKKENGKVIQDNQGLDHPFSLKIFDYRNRKDPGNLIESRANEIQASINLETGPLIKLGLFYLDEGNRLLIAIHHLVIDGVSWRILLEDIETLYHQYKKGKSLILPLKTDSFKVWSEKLSQYANSDLFLKEKTFWAELESKQIQEIKKDFEDEDNDMKDVESLSFSLEETETHLLLTKVNEAFGTEINDILLTALGLSVKRVYGNDRLLIAMEGHGREEILKDVDVSRTVGWFTSLYPVLLDFSCKSEKTRDRNFARQIKEVKESLRRVPNKGVGYGILKYLTPGKHKEEMNFKLNPQVIFNYLGQFDEDVKKGTFGLTQESVGNTHSINIKRNFQLDVIGMITNRQLVMSISYNKLQYKSETIEGLLEHYKSELSHIISFCARREERELTPNDLTHKELSIEALEQLQKQYPIEDIYTLSPMQEGLLFHVLYGHSSFAYFEQHPYRIHAQLDIDIVKKTLNELCKRYDILRTVFIYEGLERPLQVVLKERKIDLYFEDLRKIIEKDSRKKDSLIEQFVIKDRQRYFDLSKDMLMRISILRLDDSEYEFIWSFHHIVMDGWCTSLLIADYSEIYNSILKQVTYGLPAVKPYRIYIKWLEEQNKKEAERYWFQYLSGYEESASITKIKSLAAGEESYKAETVVFTFGKEKTLELEHLAKINKVTPNAIFLALWGIILGKYNDKQDVVFGNVVSGRTSEIEGVESMVGCFINTVPVRIKYEDETSFGQLVRWVQQNTADSERYHYYTLAEIQSQHLLKQDLIDHIFVFENYPIARQTKIFSDSSEKTENIIQSEESKFKEFQESTYDFNVMVIPAEEELTIKFAFNANTYKPVVVERIAKQFEEIVAQVLHNNLIKIGSISIAHDFIEIKSNVLEDEVGDFIF